jgi:hypothetical protein
LSLVIFCRLFRALSGTIDFNQPARFARRMALIESGSLCLVGGGGRFEFAAKFARIGLACIGAHSEALVLGLSGCEIRIAAVYDVHAYQDEKRAALEQWLHTSRIS